MFVKFLFLFILKKLINLYLLIFYFLYCNIIFFMFKGKIVNIFFKFINLIFIKGIGSLNEDNNIL